MRSSTLSITINRPPAQVLSYVSEPANLPRWSPSFCLSIHFENGNWVAQTPTGPVQIRIATHRQLGIADQFLIPAPGIELMIPMRVVPNGLMIEFIFTLFQPDQITEAEFQQEIEIAYQELELLKQILEAQT